MSKIPRPRVQTPTPDVLAPILAAIGLPRPVAVEPLGQVWAHANFRVKFSDDPRQDVMFRRVVQTPGYDTLEQELAALTLAGNIDGVPTVGRYQILPPGAATFNAAVSELLPGVQGMRVIKHRPDLAKAVIGTVGRLMATLADHPVDHWGIIGDTGQFLPTRRTWVGEWRAHFEQWMGTARGNGTDLGPVTDRVEAAVLENIDVLGTCTAWALVHGDLHPSNCLFGEPPAEGDDPVLEGVVDWEVAGVADPLCEWTLPLELPRANLAGIVAGFGAERVRGILADDDAMARLRVYVLTRAVRRLAFASYGMFRGERGARRAWVQEWGHVMCLKALDPDMPARKLREALDGVEGDTAAPRSGRSDAVRRVLWRSVEAPRYVPRIRRRQAPAMMGAIASALLAPDEVSSPREEWVALSDAMADRLGTQDNPVHGEPIPDRLVFARDLTAELAVPNRRVPLVLWWLFVEGVTRLAYGDGPDLWPVNQHVLRGLQGVTTALSAITEDLEPTGPQRLAMAILGCAALDRLAGLLGVDLDGPRARAAEEVVDAWEDFAVFGNPFPGDIHPDALRVRLHGRRDQALSEVELYAPAVIYAIKHLPDGVRPATPGRVLRVLGFGDPPPPVEIPEEEGPKKPPPGVS